MFFPEQVMEFLKKQAPPRQVTFKCAPQRLDLNAVENDDSWTLHILK